MRKLSVLLTGLAVLAAIVASARVETTTAAREKSPGRLQPFRSCGELVDYAKRHAAEVAAAGGFAGPPVVAGPAGGRTAGPDSSTTNVQEAGIDEPDLVKTDGSRIFAVAAGTLHAVDARSAKPRLLDSLRLVEGWGHELLLHDGRLLVLSRSAFGPEPLPPIGRPGIAPFRPTQTILSEIDVRKPGSMRVVRTLTIDGAYLTARVAGATARVVVASIPEIVESPSLQNWLPSAVLQDRRTGRKTTRALVQCRKVRRPPVFSGLGMTTVVTIDLDRGLPPVDSDAVMSSAAPVYASSDALYVATQRWLPRSPDSRTFEMTTEIHKFDSSKPSRTEYRASGAVAGFLLSQWSLSEQDGYLRAASTDLPSWLSPSPRRESESFVSVLAERAGKLVQVGRVGELGRGERVYAVRFIGDVGFVVTFRQVDPLYAIDLSHPARPKVLGELKIRGYSAYLHPVGKDLLLGVGQDATDEGRVLGTKLSLFDVSDLRRPVRVDDVALGPGSSEVEFDHHAFLYWRPASLAVLPVQISKGPFAGAIAFRVGGKRVEQLGRISHPAEAPVRRSLVAGGRLYTVSERGVEANDLATLAVEGWLPFPPPAP
jgi:uncharacterized secreted protein with C-terminal beta-propeller domain